MVEGVPVAQWRPSQRHHSVIHWLCDRATRPYTGYVTEPPGHTLAMCPSQLAFRVFFSGRSETEKRYAIARYAVRWCRLCDVLWSVIRWVMLCTIVDYVVLFCRLCCALLSVMQCSIVGYAVCYCYDRLCCALLSVMRCAMVG